MAEQHDPPPGYRTIAEVVRDELCHSCGVCGGICPKGAIDFDERARPLLDLNSCNGCGLCLQVCSGWRGTFLRPDTVPATSAYLTHSLDPQLRRQSSSGGLVTELLRYMLAGGAISKALVTVADPGNPTRPMTILAGTEAELLLSSQSRYCLFPWGKALTGLLRNTEPYAVVGTSCQLSSFNYALQLFPRLRDHLVLQIGICCESNVEPAATDHLLRIRKIRPTEVTRLEYRHGSWPGVMAAFVSDGTMTLLSNRNRLEGAINYLKLAYGRSRCQQCCDVLCRPADLTVGDPWCRNDQGDFSWRGSDGYSAVMVHQAGAMQWLTALHRDRRILLEEQPADVLLNNQLSQEAHCLRRVGGPEGTAKGKDLDGVHPDHPVQLRPRLSLVKKMIRRGRDAIHHQPLRSMFMALMLSPLGDALTALNVWRKQRHHRQRRDRSSGK